MKASMELMVETLYDGVLSPQAWGEALQAVCTRLDAYAFHQLRWTGKQWAWVPWRRP